MTAAKPGPGRPRVAAVPAKPKPSTAKRRPPAPKTPGKKLEAAVAKVAKRVGDDAARRELLAAALEVAVRVSLDPNEAGTARSRAAVEVRLLLVELRLEDDRAAAVKAVEASPWAAQRLEAI